MDHLFVLCLFARSIWFDCELSIKIYHIEEESIVYWLDLWFKQWANHKETMYDHNNLIMVILGNIWKARNNAKHRGKDVNNGAVLRRINTL